MSVEVSVKIANAEEIKKWLKEKPEQTEREFNKAIKKAVLQVNREAKKESPRRTGALRASISERTYNLGGEVTVGKRYGIFVHEGTSPSPGRYVPAIGARIKTGMHPGQRANPFLDRGVKKSERKIEQYIVDAINRIIK